MPRAVFFPFQATALPYRLLRIAERRGSEIPAGATCTNRKSLWLYRKLGEISGPCSKLERCYIDETRRSRHWVGHIKATGHPALHVLGGNHYRSIQMTRPIRLLY